MVFHVLFNETEAQRVLAIINEKIAGAFLTEPKLVRFVFLNHIDTSRRGVLLGTCNTENNEIRILVRPGWQNTAIHELAHLYDPQCSERTIGKVANDIKRYLKSGIGE